VIAQHVFDGLAVRVNEGAADAPCKISRDHVSHKRVLAGACGAEECHVLRPGVGRDDELALLKQCAGIVLNADRDRFEGHR